MRRITSRDTEPEMLLRQALRAKGMKFQACVSSLPGKPDIVFRSSRVAVFVDGEFWHGAQWEKRGLLTPAEQFTNTPSKDYWIKKLVRNQRRDCIFTTSLLRDGWRVLRFWEQDIKKNLEQCVDLVEAALHTSNRFDPVSLAATKTVMEFFAGIGLPRKQVMR